MELHRRPTDFLRAAFEPDPTPPLGSVVGGAVSGALGGLITGGPAAAVGGAAGGAVAGMVSEARRRSTDILRAVIERDDPNALAVMPLPHQGSSTRPYRPPAAGHPARRILDDERSLAQLFVPSQRARAELPGGPVVYETLRRDQIAARYRANPGINAARVEPHRRDQTVF